MLGAPRSTLERFAMRRPHLGLALLLATLTIAAHAQQPKRFMGGPVTLIDQGSFFIGGQHKEIGRAHV